MIHEDFYFSPEPSPEGWSNFAVAVHGDDQGEVAIALREHVLWASNYREIVARQPPVIHEGLDADTGKQVFVGLYRGAVKGDGPCPVA